MILITLLIVVVIVVIVVIALGEPPDLGEGLEQPPELFYLMMLVYIRLYIVLIS